MTLLDSLHIIQMTLERVSHISKRTSYSFPHVLIPTISQCLPSASYSGSTASFPWANSRTYSIATLSLQYSNPIHQVNRPVRPTRPICPFRPTFREAYPRETYLPIVVADLGNESSSSSRYIRRQTEGSNTIVQPSLVSFLLIASTTLFTVGRAKSDKENRQR